MKNLNQQLTQAIHDLVSEAKLIESKRVDECPVGTHFVRRDSEDTYIIVRRTASAIIACKLDEEEEGRFNIKGFDMRSWYVVGIEPKLRHVMLALARGNSECEILSHVYGDRLCLTIKESDGHISPRFISLTKSLYEQKDTIKLFILHLIKK